MIELTIGEFWLLVAACLYGGWVAGSLYMLLGPDRRSKR